MIGSGHQLKLILGRNSNIGTSSAAIHDGTDTEYLRGKFCIIDIDYQGGSNDGTVEFVGSSTGPGGRRDWAALPLWILYCSKW